MIAVLVLALALTGCTVAGTPVSEPPTKLDCDLIFPGPDGR